MMIKSFQKITRARFFDSNACNSRGSLRLYVLFRARFCAGCAQTWQKVQNDRGAFVPGFSNNMSGSHCQAVTADVRRERYYPSSNANSDLSQRRRGK